MHVSDRFAQAQTQLARSWTTTKMRLGENVIPPLWSFVAMPADRCCSGTTLLIFETLLRSRVSAMHGRKQLAAKTFGHYFIPIASTSAHFKYTETALVWFILDLV